MRKFTFAAIALLAGSLPALAQVTLDIVLEQNQFLSGESVPIAVRITNRSGQTLRFGNDPAWLTFSMEQRESTVTVVPKTSEVPVPDELVLETGKVATIRADVAPCFNIAQPGRYTLLANLRIPGWNREVTSAPRFLQVISGTKLWERELGVPGSAKGPNGAPEVRRYVLQQASYLKGQMRLYLRVTDASGLKILKVCPIGSIVSFSRPEPQVDSESNLHLLYQNGPHGFSYHVYNLDGELIIRQTYDYGETKPRLKVADSGDVLVVGGNRRETKTDFPPKRESEKEPDESAATNAPAAPAAEAK